jgi:hypothetical protein
MDKVAKKTVTYLQVLPIAKNYYYYTFTFTPLLDAIAKH